MPSIEQLTCKRCGYKWWPHSPKLPDVCPNPKCKSRYWNRERTLKYKNDKKEDK